MNNRKNILILSLLINVILLHGQSKTERMYLLMTNSTDHVYHWPGQELNPVTTDTTPPAVLFLLKRGALR